MTRIALFALLAAAAPAFAAADMSRVNGSITVAAGTVNGAVALGADVRVAGAVKSVNGSLSLAEGAEAGSLTNVNGRIALERAHVRGDVHTVSGDIEIGAGSRVDGGILVEEARRRWWPWHGEPPRIVIGPRAVVRGPLRFEREVQLYVSDTAHIGPVEGAEPMRFAGERPPRG